MISYQLLKTIHVFCVCLSLTLFTLRWGGVLLRFSIINGLRRLSVLNDSVLLVAALGMLWQLQQIPQWVQMKIAFLICYIVAGIQALRPDKPRPLTVWWGSAALLCAGFIVSVAMTHNPRGIFSL